MLYRSVTMMLHDFRRWKAVRLMIANIFSEVRNLNRHILACMRAICYAIINFSTHTVAITRRLTRKWRLSCRLSWDSCLCLKDISTRDYSCKLMIYMLNKLTIIRKLPKVAAIKAKLFIFIAASCFLLNN